MSKLLEMPNQPVKQQQQGPQVPTLEELTETLSNLLAMVASVMAQNRIHPLTINHVGQLMTKLKDVKSPAEVKVATMKQAELLLEDIKTMILRDSIIGTVN